MKTISRNKVQQKLSNSYVEFRKEIFDKNLTIYLSNFLSNYNDKNKQIIFVNCVFKGNLRIDNIKCYKLEFKDCRFLDGGGIKNRGKDNALYIKNFIFKPYELEGDFVIDLGAYADENGLISDKTGCIENLEFENHQKGSGRIFFVGLNDKLEFGNFRNRILDNVIFENCDLRRCVFLNSKVDKTEFRNVKFNKQHNIFLMRLFSNRLEKNISICFIIIILLISPALIKFIFGYMFPNNNEIFDYIYLAVFIFYLALLFIFLSIYVDSCYTKFLSLLERKLDKENNSYLNKHISTYDEEFILTELWNRRDSYNDIIESFKALKELYEQFAINFLKTDKQLWGEFMYSSKFYKNIIEKENFIDVFPNRFNHLINGYGRRWFRALWWIFFVIFYFGYLFTDFVKPNIDYVSTKNTPYFLLKNVKFDNKKGIIYYSSKSFTPSLKINYEFNKNININKNIFGDNLYGYDNRFNFNDLKVQYILNLKVNYWTGLCKSLSNLLYPFSFENKKWFENVTPKAFILSIIESVILWLLILALIRALWNVIVY